MILQTGLRTDIPAFYSRWFANRLQAGFVCVRNPYNPVSVTRYTKVMEMELMIPAVISVATAMPMQMRQL